MKVAYLVKFIRGYEDIKSL